MPYHAGKRGVKQITTHPRRQLVRSEPSGAWLNLPQPLSPPARRRGSRHGDPRKLAEPFPPLAPLFSSWPPPLGPLAVVSGEEWSGAQLGKRRGCHLHIRWASPWSDKGGREWAGQGGRGGRGHTAKLPAGSPRSGCFTSIVTRHYTCATQGMCLNSSDLT